MKPLKDLANLQSLDLAQNEIKDITPLGRSQGLAVHRALRKQDREDRRPQGPDRPELAVPREQPDQRHLPACRLEQGLDPSAPKNQIKDISVLSKITKLQTIDLQDNKIEDATPLAKQTELKLLMIERNKIKDLKPLVDAAKADSAGPKKFAPYLHVYFAGNPLSDKTKADQTKAP